MEPAALRLLWIPATLALLLAAVALLRTFRPSERGEKGEFSPEQLNRRLEEIDRISGRLDQLRSIFVTPHIRGGVGETLLEELIRNWLPSESYRFQYGFRDGSRADAVILLGSYIIAVDSKFPLESVQELFSSPSAPSSEGESTGTDSTTVETASERPGLSPLPASVRRSLISHAKSISSKYIRPEEGTLQFALMYIPSEAVYYRCFVRESDLAEELITLNVVPVGPYSLFLYVQTVAYGLRGFAFPERARELTELSYRLSAETEALSKELGTAATHLKNLYGTFDNVDKRARRLRSVAEQISGRT